VKSARSLRAVLEAPIVHTAEVIGVDLQGHGRTPLGRREISLVDMGNDMAGVLKKLGYDKVDVLGHSFGGGLKDAGWQHEHMSQNRLAILPNITHYEMGLAPQLLDAALPFLNGQGRAKSWDEQVSAK
jgi:alpha-beta hydrolase superfamily lysophospholipase